MAAVAVAPNFGYVAGVVGLSWLLHHGYMATQVMQARKKYEVQYPALYADKDNQPNEEYRNRFNCVQRGHQNSLENQPAFLALLVAAGLKHPITAAVAGMVYLTGRLLYFEGYKTGKPDNRLRGTIQYAGLLTLVGVAGKWAVQTISKALNH